MEEKKLFKSKKPVIAIIAVFLCLVGVVLYLVLKPDDRLQVETLAVSVETVNETLDTTGTVSADKVGKFSLPNGVSVTHVNVKPGDIVKKGDVLATLDVQSFTEVLTQKKNTYDKAAKAYRDSINASSEASNKIAEVKKQITELENEIAGLEAAAETTSAEKTTAVSGKSTGQKSGVSVSDSLVNRFIKIAGLFGVEYTQDAARSLLEGMLSAGSSTSQINSMFDNLSQLSALSGSFDMSSLAGMTSSSSLMSAQMSLIELKTQLAAYELQSDSSYTATFKTIMDKTEADYNSALAQYEKVKSGWKAEKEGIVSAVSLPGEEDTSSASDIDISTILQSVSSGTDISSMLSSLMSKQKDVITVIYYPLSIDISLSKYDVLKVSKDQKAVVKTAKSGTIEGFVSFVSPVAEASSGLNLNSLMGGSTGSSSNIPAKIELKGYDPSVIVGTDLNVSIITDTVENAMVIPVEAVCIDGDEIFVYVLEDNKAVKKDITLGISNDTYYQVLTGIGKDDVLIKNTSGLKDGLKVTVK